MQSTALGLLPTQFSRSEPYSVNSGDSRKVSDQKGNWLDMMLVGKLGLKDKTQDCKAGGKRYLGGVEMRGFEDENANGQKFPLGPAHRQPALMNPCQCGYMIWFH